MYHTYSPVDKGKNRALFDKSIKVGTCNPQAITNKIRCSAVPVFAEDGYGGHLSKWPRPNTKIACNSATKRPTILILVSIYRFLGSYNSKKAMSSMCSHLLYHFLKINTLLQVVETSLEVFILLFYIYENMIQLVLWSCVKFSVFWTRLLRGFPHLLFICCLSVSCCHLTENVGVDMWLPTGREPPFIVHNFR